MEANEENFIYNLLGRQLVRMTMMNNNLNALTNENTELKKKLEKPARVKSEKKDPADSSEKV